MNTNDNKFTPRPVACVCVADNMHIPICPLRERKHSFGTWPRGGNSAIFELMVAKVRTSARGARSPPTQLQCFISFYYFVAPGVVDTTHKQFARCGQCPSGASPPRAGSNGRIWGGMAAVVPPCTKLVVTWFVGVPAP